MNIIRLSSKKIIKRIKRNLGNLLIGTSDDHSTSFKLNDLPSVVKFSSGESYVDDTKVYLSCSSENIDSCLTKVSEDLRIIAFWCCKNKLLINPDKTKTYPSLERNSF